ncbi:MAG: hydroxymethylbilane synthase [Eubacteriales bacterium]|nr:hydroxymethylbilane synthase [Eubacteriales bacterium]
MSNSIKIGTRKSQLALIQTEIVKNRILQAFPEKTVEIVKIDTKGDQILDKSLTSFGGKGVFTAELEAELLSGQIDIAVHSAKDMPMEFPEGLGIGAALERADIRDCFVTTNGMKLADLAPGSIVGTSSLRRELLIKEINPYVQIRMLRGNVQTRLRKLKEGQYDGIILAAAGIERLEYTEMEGVHFEYMDPEQFLPAAGQGILAVECREDDQEMANVLAAINCEEAACLLEAERNFLKTIGGSCNAPAAGFCKENDGSFTMHAMYVKDGVHGKKAVKSVEIPEGASAEEKKALAGDLGKSIAKEVNKGMVYLVGAGPGDEDLFTRKGLRLIQQADVVVYDNLASSSLLNEVRDDAELIYAGKRSSHHHLKQYETNQLLVELALEGKNVVRLKGGDPYIFGRGGEEGQELREAGVDFEVVPGISSSYSVPAYCGIPVTHRDFASSFHVITGHEGNHKNGATVLNYETLAKEEGTLIFLMGLKNLPNIVASLMANGKDPETPVGVLQEGTTARQRVATGRLCDIVEIVKREGIQTPAITVVGDVVGLRDVLNWYGMKPLSGQRVIVTGSRSMVDRLSPILKEEGAEAISFSLIRTEALESPEFTKAIEEIDTYTWAVFTSANGVDCFFDKMKELRKDIRSFANVKFAVIGDGTRKALEEHGIFSDFIPTAYSSKDMAESMIPLLKKEDRVLLLRAEEANEVLPNALGEAGIDHTTISLYHTVYDMRKAEELGRLVKSADYITFASSSAVKAFVEMVDDLDSVCGKYISIGPVTTKTAEKSGLTVAKTAISYTAKGIVDVIRQDVEENR